MRFEAEVKIFQQKNNQTDFVKPPGKEDLDELFHGTMVVGEHRPQNFSEELKKLIREKQQDLLGKKLWLAVLLFEDEAFLIPESFRVDPTEDIVYQINLKAAQMVRSRDAVDGLFLFQK